MNERINRFRVDERSIRILKLCGFKNIRIALIISIVFLESNRGTQRQFSEKYLFGRRFEI